MSSIILVWSKFAANRVSKKGQTKHGFYLIFTTQKDGALYFQTPFQMEVIVGRLYEGTLGPFSHKGWGAIAKLKKKQELLVRFGYNLGELFRDSP